MGPVGLKQGLFADKALMGQSTENRIDNLPDIDFEETEEQKELVQEHVAVKIHPKMAARSKRAFHYFKASGYNIRFPHKEPYAPQKSFMSKVLMALDRSENALLESPTGTGKTLALLCSLLEWQETFAVQFVEKPTSQLSSPQTGAATSLPPKIPKIFFASRTHSQIKQVVDELKSTSYQPNMTVLGSRHHYCIHPNVSTCSKSDINEKCKEITKKGMCSYRKTADSLKMHYRESKEAWDMEDIVKKGRSMKSCPYFAARGLETQADIVFLPYIYLIDRNIRSAMDLDLENSIVVIDEAHNIEDVSSEAASTEFVESELRSLGDNLHYLCRNSICVEFHTPILNIVERMVKWIDENTKFLKARGYQEESFEWREDFMRVEFANWGIDSQMYSQVVSALGHAIKVATEETESDSRTKDSEQSRRLNTLTPESLRTITNLKLICDYMFGNGGQAWPFYRLVLFRKKIRGDWVSRICIWCLSPSVAFRDAFESTRSVILTSGTLSPLNSFVVELGTDFTHRLEAMHVIPGSQIWSGVFSRGPRNQKLLATHKHIDNMKFQDEIIALLLLLVQVVPSGTLVFFSSYSLMDRLMKRWRETGELNVLKQVADVFVESRDSEEFSISMQEYKDVVDNDGKAIFLAVCRAKISEGIDFADHYARAVVIIGIPFAYSRDPKVELKKEFNNKNSTKCSSTSLSGDQWYKLQAFRALNQAIGRCIRHIKDYGAIFLVDERFYQPSNAESLSKWLRKGIQYQYADNCVAALPELKEFFSRNKAQFAQEEYDRRLSRSKFQNLELGRNSNNSVFKKKDKKRQTRTDEKVQMTLFKFKKNSRHSPSSENSDGDFI